MQASLQRNRELSLLILGLIVGGGALALVVVANDAKNIGLATPIVTVLAAAYVGAHIVMRRLARNADGVLLPVAALLNALGLAAVYRLSPEKYGAAQLTWTLLGIACFVATIVVVRDVAVLSRYKYVLGFVGVGLLLLPLMPGLGKEINGAQLWVEIGSFRFQPGELSKIFLVVFFAAYLAERKELLSIASKRVLGLHIPDLKHFGPLLVMWGLSLAVMFYAKDLGSSLLFFSVFLVMLYIATARLVYMTAGGALFAAGAYIGYRSFSHVQERVRVWLDVFNPDYVQDEGFQLAQSLFALSAGGLFGTGLGQGRPDLIPAAHTDFIFSVLGEELGLLGAAAILAVFPPVGRPRSEDRGHPTQRLLPAARSRTDRGARDPDDHHPRRGDTPPSSNGHHVAIHVVRRVELALELHPDRLAGTHLRSRCQRTPGSSHGRDPHRR